jgi:carbohydrate-binding DOMON domain-containing protein
MFVSASFRLAGAKLKVLLGGLAVIVLAAIIAVVVILTLKPGSSALDCSGDDFGEVTYSLPGDEGNQRKEAYVKYKLVEKTKHDLFPIAEAKAKCQELGAELWQVSSRAFSKF